MKSHHRSHIEVPCDFGRASRRPRATSKPFGPAFISPTHHVGRSPPHSTSSSPTNGHSPPVYPTHPLGRSLPSTFDILRSLSARLPYLLTHSVAPSHLSFPLPHVYTSPSLGRSLPQFVTKKNYPSAVTTPTIHFSTYTTPSSLSSTII